jgi:SAM-dependent methyltransferase
MVRSMSVQLDPAREQAELRAYLGEAFELRRLQQYEAQLDDEFAATADEPSFYRTSHGYLYNLTAFAMTGTKLPYLRELQRLVEPGARLLDYGCGIGSDGLLLLEAGYRVEFADFANPSVDYLRWRLRERGLNAPIHDLDLEVPAGFDLAYALDVIEHVDDPFGFVAEMESRARIVVVNLLEPDPGEDPEFHRLLPIGAIRRRAVEHGLLSYRILHGRSHLLAYSAAARGGGTLRGRALVLRERVRRRLTASS